MNTLITGTFEDERRAREAVRKLVQSCVPMDFIRTVRRNAGRSLPRRMKGRPSGFTVAVKAPAYVAQRLALKILRDYGARDIEVRGATPQPRVRVRVSLRQQPPLHA